MNSEGKLSYKIGAIVLAGLVILTAAWHWGLPAYRHAKVKRHVVEAQVFFDKGDYRNALMSARLVLMLDSNNIPACRIMANLAEVSHSPVVLDLRQHLVELEPTVENKLALAAAALQFQTPPFPLTTQLLDQLSSVATNVVAYHSVATMLALGLNHPADAETHLAAAARLDPTNQSFPLNIAVLQLNSTNPATVKAARVTLEKFREDPNLGPAALRSLVSERLLHEDFSSARDYSTQLLATKAANLGDQLQYLGILKNLKDPALSTRLQSVQQQANTNAVVAAQIAAWMQANGLMKPSADWLLSLPAEVQSQPSVQIALAEFYMNTADWSELCRLTAKGDWNEMNFLRLAFLSRAWEGLGEPLVAASHWRSALEQTDGKLGALNLLLNFAQRWGKPAAMESLLNQLVRQYPDAAWARQALENFYLKTGNTPKLYQFYTDQLSGQPDNVASKNNAAATALLLKTNLTQACQWAAEIYAQRPDAPVFVSTYAYALHLQGHDTEGLAVFQKLSAAQLEQPSVALYYGVLLRATAQNGSAIHYLAIAEKSAGLLPEEQSLLKGE